MIGMEMLEEGNQVEIVFSNELNDMRLGELAGRTGIVTENLAYSYRRAKGYMVAMDGAPHLGNKVWYIPANSIRHAE